MKKIVFLTFLFFLHSCVSDLKRSVSQEVKDSLVSCIGRGDAKFGAIYLHGMDSKNPSDQELKNRKILQSISEKYNIKIALPRSNQACPQNQNQICWGWSFDQSEITSIQSAIDVASLNCKLPSKKILIGFSNGAYALNKIFRQCLTSSDQIIISQGANIFNGQIEKEPKNLSKCGKLIFISGKDDKFNYDPSNNFLNQLKLKSANVDLILFNGGHEVNFEALSSVIKGNL